MAVRFETATVGFGFNKEGRQIKWMTEGQVETVEDKMEK